MAHLLVLQLSPVDPPERLGDWLREAGAQLDVRTPDDLPATLDGVDGLVCLGGEMGGHDDAAHPWFADVRVRSAVPHRDQPDDRAVLGGAGL